jgi:hypothetical protein
VIRWIEPVVSDEACRLLKVAWQLVGLMTKTGHRPFRSMNQPGNANTGWTWTDSPVDDDSHFASHSALRLACRSRIVASEPAQDGLTQLGTASPRSGDIFAFKRARFRLERDHGCSSWNATMATTALDSEIEPSSGWARAKPSQTGQVVDDPFQYANHLISY